LITHTQTERRRNKANQILFLKSHYKITAFIVYSMQKTRYMWQLGISILSQKRHSKRIPETSMARDETSRWRRRRCG
jgi:hypothetical protein